LTKTFEDRKYQDGDPVVWNHRQTHPETERDSKHDQDAIILGLYTSVGKARDGDYAYNIGIGSKMIKNTVWGYQLRPAMFKYDPKQAGDTEEDI
jgi:hypothetical protein